MDMLTKEKKLTDKVKELRRDLLEKEATLYKFDDYEKCQEAKETLNKEISELKSIPFTYGSIYERASEGSIIDIPPTLSEISIRQYDKDNTFSKHWDLFPRVPLDPATYDEVISYAFANFVLNVRKSLVCALDKKLEKIEADIDSELQ